MITENDFRIKDKIHEGKNRELVLEQKRKARLSELHSRGGRIRTCGPLVPNQVH